jgi:hypothetical protein
MAMQGTFVPVIIGIVVFFAVLLTINHFFVQPAAWDKQKIRSNIMLAVSTTVGVFATWYFWI